MNIVITLPIELIAEILEGRKRFEIRKTIPRHFNVDKDVVYVVEKGTKNVPIYFSVRCFYTYTWRHCKKDYIAKQASVPVGWINQYANDDEKIRAWVIGCAVQIKPCQSRWYQLGIKSNPQSFVYTKLNWMVLPLGKHVWNPQITLEERRTLLHPFGIHKTPLGTFEQPSTEARKGDTVVSPSDLQSETS